jgi:uncharacterized protein
MAHCPICGRTARPRPENAASPFCSPRCRQIDLGCWLDEKYRVPVSDAEVDEAVGAMQDDPIGTRDGSPTENR